MKGENCMQLNDITSAILIENVEQTAQGNDSPKNHITYTLLETFFVQQKTRTKKKSTKRII